MIHVKSKPASIMEYIPQYRCPCCEAAVRREHVLISHQRRARFELTERRTVTIYCEPCGQIHKASQTRPVGSQIWEDAGSVERVDDEKHRRGVMTRIDQINGDLQRVAS